MKQNNETEKSSNELKEIAQADTKTKTANSHTTRKTELKPLTREPKKSVLEPELKNILTLKKSTRN
ncbi:hypothetical protein [Helicobacter pylori]|uniref:hypothetical protein n=1 Tax=Helicobacter pylori TaxID=210 RepID=UPI0006800860|nr:hypothetical protein [Helicobacter pylori]KNE08677.1 hypothetical protein ACM26_07195 [Helicobacter pylori]KNX46102.1 hypothetical protein AEY54_02410 [Helicobacter pylori]